MSTFGISAAVVSNPVLSIKYKDKFEGAYRSLLQDESLQDQHDKYLSMIEDAWQFRSTF